MEHNLFIKDFKIHYSLFIVFLMLMMNTPDPPLNLLKRTVSLLSRKIPNDRTPQQLESYPDVLHLWLTVAFWGLVTTRRKLLAWRRLGRTLIFVGLLAQLAKKIQTPRIMLSSEIRIGLNWQILGFDTCKWSLTVLTVCLSFWPLSEGKIIQKMGITHHVFLSPERRYLDRQE